MSGGGGRAVQGWREVEKDGEGAERRKGRKGVETSDSRPLCSANDTKAKEPHRRREKNVPGNISPMQVSPGVP